MAMRHGARDPAMCSYLLQTSYQKRSPCSNSYLKNFQQIHLSYPILSKSASCMCHCHTEMSAVKISSWLLEQEPADNFQQIATGRKDLLRYRRACDKLLKPIITKVVKNFGRVGRHENRWRTLKSRFTVSNGLH